MHDNGYATFIEEKLAEAPPPGIPFDDLNPHLFPFQEAIVKWALRRGRACVMSDCGTGKTIIQLEWGRHVPGKVLILAPLAVAEQTRREGERFNFHVNICRDQADVVDGINITNYEMLHHFDPDEFQGIVLDEAGILKNFTGKMRNQIITAFHRTPYRLACTATPAPNDYMELGNHSEFIGSLTRTEMLATYFVHDGGSTQNWRLKGHAKDDFWRWLATWGVYLRKPSDLGYPDDGYDLPPIHHYEHILDVETHVGGFLFGPDRMNIHERRAARRESIKYRCEKAAEMANESTEPWIMWCDLNDESAMVTKMIPDAVEVSGSMDLDTKTKRLSDFAAGKIRVLVTKPKIAAHGLNFQHCNNMAYIGLSDSYEAFYQSTRRCWRFGQEKPVSVHIIIGSAETDVLTNVKRKERKAKEMMDTVAEHIKNSGLVLNQEVQEKTEYRQDVTSGEGWTMMLGDCVETIKTIESDSIDYTVFSPPFTSLYTYTDSNRDMGNCKDAEQFSRHFAYLIPELLRVTKPGRCLSFHCMNLPTSKARDGIIGLSDFRGRLIQMFVDAGWIYHSEVCIWKDPVTAMQRTKALGLLHKQLKKDSCMSRQGIPDYLVTMRKPGDNPDRVEHTNESFPVSEWQEYASPIWMDIRPGDTLNFRAAREEQDERHICPLQLEVIRRAIRMWTRPNDLVLSPFAGIGSEGYIAIEKERRFCGIELKQSYFQQAVKNLKTAEHATKQQTLFTPEQEEKTDG